ncbi:hypothetical protein QTP88_004288 [Uroleucon formosanum]
MLAKHFYAIVQSEKNTVAFLKERGLIEITTPPCIHCGSQTKFYTRKERGKERTVIRCTKKGFKELIPSVKMNLCREIPIATFEKRSKMGGINTIVQVDESLMRGKRKYNRGRLLGTDIATENVDIEELSDEEEPDFNNRNFGKKLTGPWYEENVLAEGNAEKSDDKKLERFKEPETPGNQQIIVDG